MSKATQQVQRRAVLRIAADPNDVQERGQALLRSFVDAASTATSVLLNPPAAVTKVIAREFTDLGFLAVRVVQPVQDWAMLPKTVDIAFDGDELKGQVQVIPYNKDGYDPTIESYDYGPCVPMPDPQCFLSMTKNMTFKQDDPDCPPIRAHTEVLLVLTPDRSAYELSIWSGDKDGECTAPAGIVVDGAHGTYASDVVTTTGEGTYGLVKVQMHFNY